MSKENIVAIILARGGSKRLPRKNLRLFADRSLIANTITKAVASKCFSNIFVSTDNAEIQKEAERYGATAPFLRPPTLASDTASSVDALIHAVEYIKLDDNFSDFETVCLLQPTSPLLQTIHIVKAVKQYSAGLFTSLSSMTKVKTPPEWMFQIDEKTNLATPEFQNKVSLSNSDLPVRYHENGAIYIVKANYLLAHSSLYDLSNHSAFIMDEISSVDIDTQNDWDYAEFLYRKIILEL